MDNSKKTINLLPAYLQTDKNAKFLSNTFDQLIQTPELERIDGFIGHKSVSNYNPVDDSYISESNSIQQFYQLEPAGTLKNDIGEIKEVLSFDDLVSSIISQGGLAGNRRNITNLNSIHSYDPRLSWDKLINFDQYYWLPEGPNPILISTSTNLFNVMVGQPSFVMPNGYSVLNGMKIITDRDHVSTTTEVISSGTAYIIRGVGDSIKVVKFDNLDPPENLCSTINESFDNTLFDSISFDSDKKLPLIPDYVTIDIGAEDLNPWSRYNRWYHSEVLKTTAIINNSELELNYFQKAKRPIIEFQNGGKLYNFGTKGISDVDFIDNETEFPLEVIPNNLGYYIDGVLISHGDRIIFNNADDKFIRNSVYIANVSTITNLISLSLNEIDQNLSDLISVGVKHGKENGGKSYFFNQKIFKWVESQQHTYHNQAPLFDLFDGDKKSYSLDYLNSNFKGTKVFSYKEGIGTNDEILGFPIKTNSNYLGIGSIEFENNFYTDTFTVVSNNKSIQVPVYEGFLKVIINGIENYYNCWKHEADESFGYFVRAIEELIVEEISTSTIYSKMIDRPVVPSDIQYHSIIINNEYVDSDLDFTNDELRFNLLNYSAKKNDFVLINIVTNRKINSNGYYETPLSLTNNPLNENIEKISFTELTDHVKSAFINKPAVLIGDIPGNSNLNNASNNYRFGMTNLISHDNPISLPFIFLGNEKHNIVDAIRFACDQYIQWKSNFINVATSVMLTGNPNVVDAVDLILLEMGRNKNIKSLYYRSDMVPFGTDKIVREIKINSTGFPEFFLETEFDLLQLSFKSVLIYYVSNTNVGSTPTQLLHERDYIFDSTKNIIKVVKEMFVSDTVYIHIYNDTSGNYVPLTPTKLGLYPKFEPSIYEDFTFAESPITMIRGHDGSLTKAYGDFRDNILLELEKRIYNNIKVKYDLTRFTPLGIKPNFFDDVIKPHPLLRPYTIEEYNDTLSKEFYRWASKYNLDYSINDTYDESNWKTWNFVNSKDILFNRDVRGSWKSIYDLFYDNIRPDIQPWECLGFSVEPTWWKTIYGDPPYDENQIQLWNDVRTAYYRAGEFVKRAPGLYDEYKRPNVPTPTDDFGNLKNPLRFLSNSNPTEFNSPWKFGDWGPVETSWRNSSCYAFAVNITAALLFPSDYCAKFFDVSRIKKNLIGQDIYAETKKFLNPAELLIEGVDTDQTSGFINFVIEYGSSKNENYLTELRSDLTYFNFNLFYKLGGFTNKEKLQVKINAVDPESTSPGLVLPEEDFSLQLYTSKGLKSFSISGIIVERKNGKYVIKGYDTTNPYFLIYNPSYVGNYNTVSIGEKQSAFTNWKPYLGDGNNLNSVELGSANSYSNKFYKQGQIVSYNGKYYRVIISHSASKIFDFSFFQELSSLPSEGGIKVNSTKNFEKEQNKIFYGSEFTSIQEVYDIIIGYGQYLKTQGFLFEQFNSNLLEITDWYFTGKEFLYWATQNWDDGNLIVLSPFADALFFKYENSVVDNVLPDDFSYSLKRANGQFFEKENIDVSRIDGVCKIQTTNTEEGIFFANLNTIQKQHGIVFNNVSVFNDTIFDLPTGYRQERLKISGFRTKRWNGDLVSPGFVYDVVSIGNWDAYQTYYPTQVVKFNGQYYSANQKILNEGSFDFQKWNLLPSKPFSRLLPNFDYKINQFEDFYSLDINNFDVNQQTLSQQLIGYIPRPYLSKLITDPISQYKFYQGFIREKGTKNAIQQISKLNSDITSSIEIEEEWAFRIGSYGSYKTFNELEIQLNEGNYFENPYLMKLTNKNDSNLNGIIHQVTSTNILITPESFSYDNVFITVDGNFIENNISLNNAGYVRVDDITATAFNKNSILDIANNNAIQNGNTIWLGFLENGDWTVYRYTSQAPKISGVYVSNPGSEITFVTDINHNLNVNDIISIVKFNNQVNGIYYVSSIPKSNQFTVQSTLGSIVNEPLINYGSLFKFTEVRFENYESFSKFENLFNLEYGSKVWIDKDEDNKWVVLEKLNNYSTSTEYKTSSLPSGQRFGAKINANNNSVLVSSPEYFDGAYSFLNGRVSVFQRLSNDNLISKFNFTLNQINGIGANFCNPLGKNEFGYSIEQDYNKNLFIVGAPSASLVKGETGTSYVNIVSPFSNSRTFQREGLVKISSRNLSFSLEDTKVVLSQPFSHANTNTRFGHSLYINKVDSTEPTMLLVGAPGSRDFIGTGTVFAYSLIQTTSSFTVTNYAPSSVGDVYISTNPVSTSSISVIFSAPGSGGTTATGIVIKEGNVGKQVVLTNRGSGYSSAPTVTFTGTNMSTIGSAISTIGTVKVAGTYTIQLNPGNRWGYAISGSSSGDTIAISAPRYYDNGVQGIVQVFDRNLNWKQTLTSPFNYDGEFGTSLKVSSSGNFIFVGSKKASSVLNTFGKVAVFKLNNDLIFELLQIIENPMQNTDLVFAESISISDDESTLAISSLGTNITEYLRFYKNVNEKTEETTFDNGQTKFYNSVLDSGTVYIFNNFNGNFVQAEELIPENLFDRGNYGADVVVSNNSIFVGAPYQTDDNTTVENSRVYQFKKLSTSTTSWKKIRIQEPLTNPDSIQRVALVDLENNEVDDYLDVYDPIKGRIPGIADQEISFKSIVDPAIYSVGISGTIINPESSWIEDHVGELWWDLSTAKFLWYEQGDEIYRKNNWGKLFPGASIDVYEWVKTTYLPSEWASIADTTDGILKNVSGQPKYPDNSVISVKQVLNTVTGAFENVYFYWVKNKRVLPNNINRRLTGYQVSQYIADPIANGIQLVEIISKNAMAFGNIQNKLVKDKVSVNIAFDGMLNKIPRHTEWTLLSQGTKFTLPEIFNKKLVDSLIGKDNLGNPVPDPALSFRNRYGLSIRPRQTIFKDRFEALRNVIQYSNSILKNNIIVGIKNLDTLKKVDPIPLETENEYDFTINDYDFLYDIDTGYLKQGKLSCVIQNGKITRVNIVDPGFGYKITPKVFITPNIEDQAEIIITLDESGRISSTKISNPGRNFISPPRIEVRPHAVVITDDINSNNRWAIYNLDYTNQIWLKVKTQLYNTTLFWNYIDYVSENFDIYKYPKYFVTYPSEINSITDISLNDYVKVQNQGDGRYLILEKVDSGGDFNDQFNVVFSESATIEFKENLWNFKKNKFSYDELTLDESLYDQLPDIELSNIIIALKEDIFVDNLQKYWNELFFISVKYALSEQKNLDWAFKTSFINVKNKLAKLESPKEFRLDSSEYIEDYIREIKPYKTKIRNFSSAYEYIENSELIIDDFDMDPVYGQPSGDFYVKEVILADGGEGYSYSPTVIFNSSIAPIRPATAEAYIRGGKVYKVVITDPGSGYFASVSVAFNGGGNYITKPASASAIISNDQLRKNTIELKFDRYSKEQEIGSIDVDHSVITDGSAYEFDLPYVANTNKSTIVPTLDKKLIYSSDYDIVLFRSSQSRELKSKFVLKTGAPTQGKLLRIKYQKNMALFNAIDRVENFYNPTSDMIGKNLPLLMKGLEYPKLSVQGLYFNYSTPVVDFKNIYDNGGGWNDFVKSYSRNKVINSASITTNTLYLNSVDDIVIGQALNFIDNENKKIRTGTKVLSINTAANSIEISQPTFLIKTAKSTSTSVGTPIRIVTKTKFNGELKDGDLIEISGVSTSGFDGIYSIYTATNYGIESNNSFYVLATNILGNTTSSVTSNSKIKICSLLEPITTSSKVVGTYDFYVGNCVIPRFKLTPSTTRIAEGYTATFTITGENVVFGDGRTFSYSIIGDGITSGDFVSPLVGTITTTATSLPLSFNLTLAEDAEEPVEEFTVNLMSYITSSTVSSKVLAKTKVLVDDKYTTESFTIIAKNYKGETISTIREGEIVTLEILGTQLDYGSNGKVLQILSTGTNISSGDIVGGLLSDPVIVDFTMTSILNASIDVEIQEDSLTEGLERIYFNLVTYKNVLENTWTTISTSTYVDIIDTSLTEDVEYRFTATSIIVSEGSSTEITLISRGIPVGTYLGFTITNVLGNVTAADIGLSNLYGTFLMYDGAPSYSGYQTGTIVLNVADDAASIGYEGFESFRISLNQNTSTYIDITIQDQLFNTSFGTKNVYGYAVNSELAYSQTIIKSSGDFEFNVHDLSVSPSTYPAGEKWASDITGTSNYYVRAVLEPYDGAWTGDVNFTGPGFTGPKEVIDHTYLSSVSYSAVYGDWVLISAADSFISGTSSFAGWSGYGVSNGSINALAKYKLTIQIASTSGGTVIASGYYNSIVSSSGNSTPEPGAAPSGSGGSQGGVYIQYIQETFSAGEM